VKVPPLLKSPLSVNVLRRPEPLCATGGSQRSMRSTSGHRRRRLSRNIAPGAANTFTDSGDSTGEPSPQRRYLRTQRHPAKKLAAPPPSITSRKPSPRRHADLRRRTRQHYHASPTRHSERRLRPTAVAALGRALGQVADRSHGRGPFVSFVDVMDSIPRYHNTTSLRLPLPRKRAATTSTGPFQRRFVQFDAPGVQSTLVKMAPPRDSRCCNALIDTLAALPP